MSVRNAESIAPWTACWQFDSAANHPKRPELDLLIEPIWYEFVDTLAEGSKALDLATGNGAVALSCAERARMRRLGLQIDAVDAAGINPPHQVPDPEGHLPLVRFQGGVWLEELPFRDGEFDAVMSQYGFEYADEEQTVSEVSRVMSPNARLRLVIHAQNGAVWRDINYRHERLSRVLAEDGVVNLVLAMVRAQQKNDIKTFNSKLNQLSAAAQEAQKLADQPPSDDSAFYYAREFLYVWSHRKQYRPGDMLRSMEGGWAHANGTASRYAQMLRVAKSAEDIAGLCDRLKSAGLNISAVRQVCNPGNCDQIAWLVDASMPG